MAAAEKPREPGRGERREGRLEKALKLNKPLAMAYYMKEDLRQIWDQPGKRVARGSWTIGSAGRRHRGSGCCSRSPRRWWRTGAGLLNYYDVMISRGPMEGTNNKIKTMQRQAYGFRDQEFFKLKILAIHETRYELVG